MDAFSHRGLVLLLMMVTQSRFVAADLAAEEAGIDPSRPPRTAFLLVGAAYDAKLEVFQRYLKNVVNGYEGETSTFALLKGVHFKDSAPYSPAALAALNSTVYRTLHPVAASIESVDQTAVYHSYAGNAVDCLWPRPGVGLYSKGFHGPVVPGYLGRGTIIQCKKRFEYWWGAMQLAWDMLSDYEQAQDFKFERVIFLRVGVDVKSKMPSFRVLKEEFYTETDVPDVFWVMSRRLAEQMLQTVSKTISCMNTSQCCERYMRSCKFKQSWYIPCYWSRKLKITPIPLTTSNAVNLHGEQKAPPPTGGAICYPWDPRDRSRRNKCGGGAFDGDLSHFQTAAPFSKKY